MDRRNFLSAMLAACAAPAIVRADALMRVMPIETIIFNPYALIGRYGYTWVEWERKDLILNEYLLVPTRNPGDVIVLRGMEPFDFCGANK